MAVISEFSYEDLVLYYTRGLNQVQDVATHYYDAAYEIVQLNTFQPEIELLIPFYSAYLAAVTSFENPPSSIISAVKTLQKHILDNATDTTTGLKYTNINSYYDDTGRFPSGYQVSTQFALVSELAGYHINGYNDSIDPASASSNVDLGYDDTQSPHA